MHIERLRGKEFRKALLAGIVKVQDLKEELNRINVFPVPDGDTGTNLASTLLGGITVLRESEGLKLCEIVRRFSEALLFSARGNSGTIISQFFVGLADALKGKESVSTVEFAEALEKAYKAVYESLENPVEGTIITVMRDCADYALKLSREEKDFIQFFGKILKSAEESLKRTPQLLPKLKEKKVVDAGAYGFVLLLKGIMEFIEGKKVETVHKLPLETERIIKEEDIEHRYCTEAVIKGEGLDKKKLALILGTLGSSLLIAGGSNLLKVHIHTNWPHKVFELLKQSGTILKQKIEDMLEMNIFARKGKFGIVVDSSSDIPLDLAQELGINVIPLQILIDGKVYLDTVDIDKEEVLSKLLSGTGTITTSQPDPKTVERVIKEALSKNRNLLVFTLSSKLSGTYNSLRLVTSKYPEIYLYDSKLVSLGITLLAMRAHEKFSEGYELEEVIEYLTSLQSKAVFLFTLNTVKYLVKSGRISTLKGGFAEFLGVKPILTMSRSGTLESIGNALGRRAAFKKLTEMLKAKINTYLTYDFALAYVGDQRPVEELEKFIVSNFRFRKIIKGEVGPILSIYAGPGAYGVFAIPCI